MLTCLIPFNVKVEEIKAGLLREGYAAYFRDLRISALLDEIAQLDASISRTMTRLSCFVNQEC
jgi:hypothetical protein